MNKTVKITKDILLISIFLFRGNFLVFPQSELYSVKLAPFSSVLYDESAPVYFKNEIVFSSNKNINSFVSYQNQQKSLYNIFIANPEKTIKRNKSRLFAKELSSNYNDGQATFNKEGDKMYFARNINIYKTLKDVNDRSNRMGIFFSEFIDGKWSEAKQFDQNQAGYSNISPRLSPDGKTLYFSSDRPGGFGGYDLYSSEFKDGNWQKPRNLGSSVNTSADESYPFLTESGKLIFSSDGHGGFGGIDIFYTLRVKENWISPMHLDSSINSPADDFSLITNDNLKSGYFTSNRIKNDDIFAFRKNLIEFDTCVEQQKNVYCFLFYDERVALSDSVYPLYEWDFGGGDKIEGEKVKYCFPGPGKYSVLLRVMNANTGDTINNPSPFNFELEEIEQAFINHDSICLMGETIHLDGLQTNLPGLTIKDYVWDFGDGFDEHGPYVNHKFYNEGDNIVKLGIVGVEKSTGVEVKKCVYKRITITEKRY